MTKLPAAARVYGAPGGREEILPDQLSGGVGEFYGQGVGQIDFPEAGGQVFRMEQADALDLKAQGRDVRYTACDSETCRWQLEHGTALPSRHPIEILAAAYGLYDLERRDVIAGKRDRSEKR